MIRTGRECLDSIRDAREVYINGERVTALAEHPMFKPLIDIRARIYDMQHESGTRKVLSYREARNAQLIELEVMPDHVRTPAFRHGEIQRTPFGDRE
jgi:aromatic ring hydroxylase